MSALPMIHAQGMEAPPEQVLSAPSSPQGCCSLYADTHKATSDSQRSPRRSTFSPEAVSLLLPNSSPVSLILTPLEKDGAGVRVACRLRIDMALHSEEGVPLCRPPPTNCSNTAGELVGRFPSPKRDIQRQKNMSRKDG